MTFYRSTEDLPDFRDYSMRNRTYRYMLKDALYPFGYGLSYTKFEYSGLQLSKETIGTGEAITCTVRVKNTGSVGSKEAVQLYLKDLEASVSVPRWELRGFKKVFLEPGEEKEVQFTLTPRMMALINEEGQCILEPGRFEVFAGGSQPDGRSRQLTGMKVLSQTFTVAGPAVELEY